MIINKNKLALGNPKILDIFKITQFQVGTNLTIIVIGFMFDILLTCIMAYFKANNMASINIQHT
jgi:hypothetical protein